MGRRRERERRPPELQPVAGRVPPNDLDAEAACLSSALLSADARAQVAALVHEPDWYAERHRWIWHAISELERSGQRVDLVTVATWLRDHDRLQACGGTPYLAQLADATPSVSNVGAHAQIVADRARVRQLMAECQAISAEGYGELGDAREFLLDAEARVYNATSAVVRGTGGASLGEAARAAYAHAGRVHAGERIPAWATGYRELDDLLGGWKPAQVYVVAGRPGMGKSVFAFGALERLVRANADLAGVAFSMEMKHQECAQRALSRASRVPLPTLERAVMSPGQWRRTAAAIDELADLPIWIDDTKRLTPFKIRSRARRHMSELRERFGSALRLGVIVVDYVQLLSADGEHDSRVQEYEAISRELALLADDLDATVIAVAQLNRANEERGSKRGGERRPQLSDLKGCGAWEQDAHKVIFVHREDYYEKDRDKHDGLAEIILAKARDRRSGSCTLRWEGECTLLESHEDDPQRAMFEEPAAE